jgi:MFS family permease
MRRVCQHAGVVNLRTSRLAAAAAFFTQGFVFISLTTRLPDITDRYDLGEVATSLVLLMMVLLAAAGSLIAEKGAVRRSSATMLRTSLLGIAVALPFLGLSESLPPFLVGMAIYGVALGAVDATTNMQAVALEHRYARPILPSFHGAWTLGGVVGSALTLATAHLDLWLLACLAVVPLAAAAAPLLRGDRSVVPPASGVGVPWRPILLVGLAMLLFYMVDVAAQTWGPTYLENTLDSPGRLVALATFPYLVASGLLRLAGDVLVARFGAVLVLRVGAVVAAVGLAVVVFAPSWPVGILGFTLTGAGAAVIAPLSFSAAARIAGDSGSPDERLERVDAVIARFNQFNYVGALLGAVLTGLVGAGSLRVGFAVPMVLVLAIVVLAPAFVAGAESD